MDTKNIIFFAAHIVIWAAMLCGGYVSLDTVAAVSPKLAIFVIAALAIYGVAMPMVLAIGLVFWQSARREVEANQLVRW